MPDAQPPVALPKVDLHTMRVPFSVLSLIPLPTVEKYQVAVFASEKDHLKLAIVYPEQLKQGFYTALKDLGAKIGKSITLYQTDAASLRSLIQQYKDHQATARRSEVKPAEKLTEQSPASAPIVTKPITPASPAAVADFFKDTPKPPLFEIGKTVAFNYLRRVPLEFAKQHRIVSVDFLPPNQYWFITDADHQAEATTLFPFIAEKNDIVIHPLTVSAKELTELLEYYEELSQQKTEAATKAGEPGPELQPEKETVLKPMINEEVGSSKGLVTPELQATIVSKEQEKGGIAGVIQRMAQNIAATDKPEVSAATAEPVVSVAAAAVPPTQVAATEEPTTPGNREKQVSTSVSPQGPAVTAVATTPAKDKDRSMTENEVEIGKLLDKPVESIDELKAHIRKGFIPQIVAAVVSFAIFEKASDIHIEAYEDEVRIRYRIDGQLLDVVKLPPDIHAAMVSRIKILSKLRLDETRVPQDGRFDMNFSNVQVDLRVSVMPTVHGEKVVMRILDKSRGISSLESLGLEGMGYQNLLKAIERPYGICLATGPTGSGKSTSLYAVLHRIATPNVNVVTLEDPVEYEIKGINQSQIKPKIGFTFAEGLRAILRQDPNIIMVGEIRDGETATMATQAALTGHLVLSTLHTNDAAGAIPRLTNMGIEPFLIASSLNVAMGQRLIRKICQKCKSEIPLPPGVADQIKKDIEAIREINPLDAARIKEPFTFYQGQGCEACGGKGYEGRIGIYEVLPMSEAIEELTLQRASASAIQEQAQKEGMITMYQDGLLKVISGITTLDEVLREAANK